MRFLIGLASAFAAAALTTPWIFANIDDSAFKQDLAFVPATVTGREGVKAIGVAEAVKMRANERGIVLPPDGLKVEVSASKEGRMKVVGGVMAAVSHNSLPIQDVSITASYERRILGLFKRHVAVTVVTTAPGSGTASSYPSRESAEK